jgi:flagellar protein FliS
MRTPAAAYHQLSVESASPIELVVMLYDRAIVDLQEAIAAVGRGDIEVRTKHLKHFCKVINQLECSLDYEHGGKVARDLAKSYQYARAQALAAAVMNSKGILTALAEHFSTLRDAWLEAEQRLPAWPANTDGKTEDPAEEVASESPSPDWNA